MVRPLAIAFAALAALASPAPALAGSETPPPGPPWIRDFHAAREKALAERKPIFVYLTKTH